MVGQDWAKQALCRGMHVDMTLCGQGISARLVPLYQVEGGRGRSGEGGGKGRRVKGRGGSPTSAETQSSDFLLLTGGGDSSLEPISTGLP